MFLDSAVAAGTASETDYVVEAPHRFAPLIITFGFASWETVPQFDFVGRLRKLDANGARPINRIYVRDTSNFWYQHGVSGLGESVDEAAAALRLIVERLQPISVNTLGQSMGGYAAIMFGTLLGVDRVLAFGPLSHIRSDLALRDGDTRWLSMMKKLDRFPPAKRYDDLVTLLASVSQVPPTTIVYGSATTDTALPNMDSLHANRLATLPNVSVREMKEAPHAVVQWLIEAGQIDRLLSEWLFRSNGVIFDDSGWRKSSNPMAVTKRNFDHSWRGWLAENINLGVAADVLLETLVANRFNPAEAQREIDRAGRSPYLRPSAHLFTRLNKREWLLGVHKQLRQMAENERHCVPRRHKLSRDDFLAQFYSANLPVIITGMMENWPALCWTLPLLSKRLSGRLVQVQTRRESNVNYEIEADRHQEVLTFERFARAVSGSIEHNDIYMTAGNAAYNRQTVPELWDDLLPIPDYLRSVPGGREAMLWIGPAGTITPTHHDLTNNLVAQISGTKRVWLADSTAAANLYNRRHVYSDVDLARVDTVKYPLMRDTTVFEVDVAPGELLFLPIGWWHQVRALTPSITATFINFVFDNDFHRSYPERT